MNLLGGINMKYEWKKHDKQYYLPKTTPTIIDIPSFKYITIEGKGNPNSDQFGRVVEALYSLSYAIRMMPKKGFTPEGYFEYTVFPLEGIWDLDEEGRKLEYLDKDKLVYKLMIRQPGFVTDEVFEKAKELSNKKISSELLNQATFESIEEGKCVQCMHLGSYDDEPITFSMMESFCTENNIMRIEKTHREIYISDARKTPPEKLKTVIRFKVSN
ncbi:MAG: hypothetical protein K0S34_61 [Bacillales bacterium]|jgi:hypothetical protein|nr:hypothetical protein [Bacillales bacterium]